MSIGGEITPVALILLRILGYNVRIRGLRLALAVVVGLAAWWLYLWYALPLVQWINGRYPQAFQIAAVVLAGCVLGLALESRMAKRHQTSAP